MRVIDAHVHLYPPEAGREPIAWAARNSEKQWMELCTRRRKNGQPVQGFPRVDELLRAMDAAGVGKAVLLGWYWKNHATCVWQNRFYAECVQAHPDRLAAFATAHAAGGEAALEEVRWARDAGLIGLGELSPHAQKISLNDPWWIKLIELAGDLKLPVNLHVTDPHSAPYPGRVETPLADFIRLAREFPLTRFILAHWGGGLAFDSECRPLKNVWYDTAASPLMYGAEVWARAVAAGHGDRILFGSDYPLILYPKSETKPGIDTFLDEARSADLPERQTAALLGENAKRLFGW